MSRNQLVGVVAFVTIVLGVVGWSFATRAHSPPGIKVLELTDNRARPEGSSAGRIETPTPHNGTVKSSGPETGRSAESVTSKSAATSAGSAASSPADAAGTDARAAAPGGEGASGSTVGASVKPMAKSGGDGGSDSLAGGEPASKPEVVVQVAGAVRRPGVYHLSVGARNDDAVKAAGGLSPGANAASVNLAARANDGSQLYVKSLKEQSSGGVGDESAGPLAQVASSNRKAAAGTHGAWLVVGKRGSGGKSAKLKDPSEGKVNINTASAEELMRLPHIGSVMADKVIAYRAENHGFQSLEELMQVKGIGAKTFAKMAPFVKIR